MTLVKLADALMDDYYPSDWRTNTLLSAFRNVLLDVIRATDQRVRAECRDYVENELVGYPPDQQEAAGLRKLKRIRELIERGAE